MKKFLSIAALLLATLPAFGQVRQSGTVTPRHLACWTTTGVIQDCGSAASGFPSSLGVTNNGGPGICINSAATTAPYNQLCLSVSTSSAAELTLQNFGGAAAQTFQFKINGTVISLPGAGGGTSTIPTVTLPLVANDAICAENTTGALKDCGGGYQAPISAATGLSFTSNVVGYNINALATKGSPNASTDFLILYDGDTGTTKKCTVGACAATGVAGVTSFNSRIGGVLPQADDYGLYAQGFFNCSITASVSANTLTLALKNGAGSDASSSSPCVLNYRSPTAATGTIVTRTVTSANSVVVPASASLGTTNNVPFRIWIIAADDGGTERLGVIVCTTSGITCSLPGWGIISSSQITAAATAAQTFYTSGAAVSSKAFIVLGYATYESGLATAGTYDSAPTRVQMFLPGTPLPGGVIQSRQTATSLSAGTTSTTYVTTGLALTLTPTSAANGVAINVQSTIGQTANAVYTEAKIVRGGTDVGYPTLIYGASIGGALIAPMGLSYVDLPGTTSSTTYTVFFKTGNAAGTAVFCSNGPGDGGCTMQVQEIMG